MPARTDTVVVYTLTEAADLIGISRVTMWRAIRDGKLVAHRQHNTTLIYAADLLDYVIAHRGGITAVTA